MHTLGAVIMGASIAWGAVIMVDGKTVWHHLDGLRPAAPCGDPSPSFPLVGLGSGVAACARAREQEAGGPARREAYGEPSKGTHGVSDVWKGGV